STPRRVTASSSVKAATTSLSTSRRFRARAIAPWTRVSASSSTSPQAARARKPRTFESSDEVSHGAGHASAAWRLARRQGELMAGRQRASFQKRERERARQEKQAAKRARRQHDSRQEAEESPVGQGAKDVERLDKAEG